MAEGIPRSLPRGLASESKFDRIPYGFRFPSSYSFLRRKMGRIMYFDPLGSNEVAPGRLPEYFAVNTFYPHSTRADSWIEIKNSMERGSDPVGA
jgi:hypothetical protein